MRTVSRTLAITGLKHRLTVAFAGMAIAGLISGCGAMGMGNNLAMEPAAKVSLSGAAEVPANSSPAKGSGNINVGNDHVVSGSVTTTGIDGTAAHIHLAAKGANGPVIVPLIKTAEGTWSVPAGATLTDSQYASYVAGDTYVNVHSVAMPAGEIRGQLSPK